MNGDGRCSRPGGFGAGVAFVCLALLAPAPAANAASVGVSNKALDDFTFGRACGAPSCTFVNDKLSEGKVRAPVSGTITRWRANVGEVGAGTGPVEVQLQTLRRTVNEPGVAADEYRAIRETPSTFTTVEGVNKFHASMRIRKGDYIGLRPLGENVEVFGRDEEPGNRTLLFAPPLIPRDPATTASTILGDERIAFNATIKK